MSTMHVPHVVRARPSRSWFFSIVGGIGLFAVAIGFGRTYAVPMARGTFVASAAVHVHGALAFAWVLLFVAQPLLVRWGRLGWHRRVGRAGLPLAVGVAVTMVPAGVFQATRDAAAGGGPDVWIVVAMVHDRLTRGAVHPVPAWAGSAVILEQSFEVFAFDTPLWRSIAQKLYGWLRSIGL